MGACRLYKCQCGYEKKIMLGAGRSAQNLNIIGKTVPEEIFGEFTRELWEERVTEYCLFTSVISCPKCRELNSVAEFSYTLPDKAVRYVSPCPGCGESLPPLEDSENIPCPECGAKMEYSFVGLWD